MANTANGRVPSKVLEEDIDAYFALQTISTYAPNNPEHSLDAITATYEKMRADDANVIRIQVALDAARDSQLVSHNAFHQQMLGAKDQVKGQFGPDSNEVAALGLKKKSDRKPRSRGGKSETDT